MRGNQRCQMDYTPTSTPSGDESKPAAASACDARAIPAHRPPRLFATRPRRLRKNLDELVQRARAIGLEAFVIEPEDRWTPFGPTFEGKHALMIDAQPATYEQACEIVRSLELF